MLKPIVLIALTVVVAAGPIAAQQPPQPPPAAQKAEPAARPEPPGVPANVKLELTLNDQSGPGTPAKKTVTLIVADGRSGALRSSGQVSVAQNRFNVELNLDATVAIVRDKWVRLTMTLEYRPKPGAENASTGEGRGALNESLTVYLESGKPMIVSQAADPTSDRKIDVLVTATILK